MNHPQGVSNYHANKDLKIPSIEGYEHEINYNHQRIGYPFYYIFFNFR